MAAEADVGLFYVSAYWPKGQGGGPPIIKEHPQSIVARRNDPATLNCAAANADTIRWYRDGHEVSVSPTDPRSHRVLLPSGSLFFLRVSTSRRETDAGTYWCVATNDRGAVRSHNATLMVASLMYDFQDAPKSQVKARSGQSLLRLPCQPPKGAPPPTVTWHRNGRLLENSSRAFVTDEGDLFLKNLVAEDSGLYVCRASNLLGSRETAPARVTVMTPPMFEERPANLTVSTGVMVELVCKAHGNPKPKITWRRLDSKMPIGRTSLEHEQKLMLTNVESEDSGVYVCEAESEAGVAVSRSTLVVVAAPVITQKPQDLYVLVGEDTQLTCHVEEHTEDRDMHVGVEDSPMILWRLPRNDRSAVLAKEQVREKVHVNFDGTILNINSITIRDSGFYQCWGVSSGGGVSAKSKVVVVEAYPPPVVGVGPQDIQIVPGATATFPCEAVSENSPPTVTWWYRREVHLDLKRLIPGNENPRFSHSLTGALIINDVSSNDDGIYTCRITSATGSVEHSAILRVEANTQMSNTHLNLPAPPTKPGVKIVNETTVHLTWLPNSQVEDSSRQSYTVEYWRQGWEEWRVADALIGTESCLVSKLVPGITYTFLVRAVTRQGTSFPSPWSDPITVKSIHDQSYVTLEKLHIIERQLARPTISLINVTAKSTDHVHIRWKLLNEEDDIALDGILVYAMDSNGDIQVTTILGASSTSYHINNLHPNTEYVFFLVPFWGGIEGTPSNSQKVTTPPDSPVSAPSDIVVNIREKGAVLITWSGLSPSEARGEILGYQVTIIHNGSQSLEVVNTAWLEKYDLVKGNLYTVQVAAFTDAGVGPFSLPVLMDLRGSNGVQSKSDIDHMNNGEMGGATSVIYSPPQAVWVLYVLVPVIIIISVITLFYVCKLKRKTSHSSNSKPPSLYQGSLYSQPVVNMYGEDKSYKEGKEKCWNSTGNEEWRPMKFTKDSSVSSSLLRSNCSQHYAEPQIQMPYDCAEPYATTALLVPSSPAGYRAMPRTAHGPPWPGHTYHSDHSDMQVNWDAILPPPPTSPPPVEQELGHPGNTINPYGVHRPLTVSTSPSPPSSSIYDNMEGCDRSSSGSSHTYEMYTKLPLKKGIPSSSPSPVYNNRRKYRSRKDIIKVNSLESNDKYS
ncbi:unnamed protein product, partial [Meganyctiphanes norvegica]